MTPFSIVFVRDLKVAFRRWSELANPLIFFVIVVALFPLALSPDPARLQQVGVGILWISALLSSLLALEGLFRADAEDGTLEQLMLSPVPLGVTVLAKVAAHWLMTILPLIAMMPLLALSFYLPTVALPTLALALLLATPTLSVLVALGAALTVSLKRGGAIVGLLDFADDRTAVDFRRPRDGSQCGRGADGRSDLFACRLGGACSFAGTDRHRRGAASGARVTVEE